MRDEYPAIQTTGGDVVVVTMGQPGQVKQFRAEYRLPFPVLADPDKSAYQAFHVPRGNLLSVAGPGMWASGALSFWKHGAGAIVGDPFQLSGTFVINKAGQIRLAHYSQNSADFPPLADVLAALRTTRPKAAG